MIQFITFSCFNNKFFETKFYTQFVPILDINECSSSPCQNDGACNDGVNRYTCSCVAGYNGVNCQRSEFKTNLSHTLIYCTLIFSIFTLCVFFSDINECSSSPCQNGGTCVDGINRYSCSCVAGYNGANCQTSTLS